MAEEKKSLRSEFFENLFGPIGAGKKEEKKEVKEPGEAADRQAYRLVIDNFQTGVEANYYWILRFFENREDFGLGLVGDQGEVLKLKDVMGAGEASSLWGSVEQRKAIQQEKISTYLATIGKMIKDLFQILRELRILDERLKYYSGYNNGNDSESIALKSVWIDLVEGGSKNPGSVTGLAAQVGFVILPDLFYRIHPKKSEDIDKLISKDYGQFKLNPKVIEVLKRKLAQFLIWKESTEKELNDRKKFTLAYLRQHFASIRVYISWLKPYLKNVRQLQMGSSYKDPHLVSSFETSKVELELLGKVKKYKDTTPNGLEIDKEYKKYFPCVFVKIRFVALPEMSFQKEYQRAPMHMGRTEIYIQGYVATDEQIEAYMKKIEQEDFELLNSLDESLFSLQDVLFNYLKEAKEKLMPIVKEDVIQVMEKSKVNKEKAIDALQKNDNKVNLAIESLKKEEPKDSIIDPFKAVFEGFKEIFNIRPSSDKALPLKKDEDGEKENAKKKAKQLSGVVYLVYKKAHGFITQI